MAGSYHHAVNRKTGALRSNKGVVDMLENGGDVFEAVEEMYGMIWFLASVIEADNKGVYGNPVSALEVIEAAQTNYKEGLKLSPTKRYK